MPGTADILAGLARSANQLLPLAVVWHAVVAAALLALALGWRPGRRTAAAALAVPAASVSAVAWSAGNPFNGTAFLIVAILLAAFGARLPRGIATRGPGWTVAIGAAAIAYAWLYPEFLQGRSTLWYAVASPIGLIPCPTLSLILGFGLVADGFASRGWTLVAAIAGLFYGLFGVLRLGVWFDVGLIVAAGALMVRALSRRAQPRSRKWVEVHSW